MIKFDDESKVTFLSAGHGNGTTVTLPMLAPSTAVKAGKTAAAAAASEPGTLQARYRRTCPSCSKLIEPGHPIRPLESDIGKKRRRWAHADCNNVPAGPIQTITVEVPAPGQKVTSTAPGVDQVARTMIADLKMTVDAVGEKAKLAHSTAVDVSARVAYLSRDLQELIDATPKRIVVQVGAAEPVEVKGAAHPALEEVVELIAAGEPVFLPGPTGCGKSHLAKQAADALGKRFFAISCSAGMSESHLLGRCIPRGNQGQFEFCGTDFLDAYENGGVFLFDEIDAADPNVLLVINSALANGYLSVPARHEKPVAHRHEDFRCIAAANTFGKGADRRYCGRNPIDDATLDRFRLGMVPCDYDRALEKQLWLAYHSDTATLTRLWDIRGMIDGAKLERTVSTRFIIAAAKAIARGKSEGYVIEKLTAGWRDDEKRKIGC